MGSSRGQDHSLGSGLSLPQWMKGRMDSRYDFDQSSFSPPSHDDSFFYIRYPKLSETSENSGNQGAAYRPISKVLNENTINPSGGAGVGQLSGGSGGSGGSGSQSGPNTTISSNINAVKNIDYSKHPLPCQPFVPAAGRKEIKPASGTIANKVKLAKSQGTDDGFHGEPALCGKSIVHVANRIMSKTLMKADTAEEGKQTKVAMEKHEDEFLRKPSSKSLPVTPIASPISTPDTSPKSRRKIHSNRYFTGAFLPDRDKYPAGWILSSILGQSREVMNNRIQEEEEQQPTLELPPSKFLNRKKSISSQNLSYLGNDETRNVFTSATTATPISTSQYPEQQQQQPQTSVYTNVFQAKPSELREMNFWSPTSM